MKNYGIMEKNYGAMEKTMIMELCYTMKKNYHGT